MIDYKTSISTKTWREQPDSPALWVFVIASSVALHLALLWIMNLPIFTKKQQNFSNAVPIEFFETSPSSHPKATPQPRLRRQSVTQKFVSKASSKKVSQANFSVKSPQSFKDTSAIALNNTQKATSFDVPKAKVKEIPKKTTVAPKALALKTEPILKPDLADLQNTSKPDTPETLQAPKPIKKQVIKQGRNILPHKNPKPTLSPEIPVETEQQDLPLTEQQPLDPATANLSPSPDTQQQLPTELPKQPGGEVKIGMETSLNKKGGGIAIATWDIEPGAFKKDLPDNPARPKTPIREKLLNLPSLESGDDSQPKELRAYLLINNDTGKVMSVVVYPDDLKRIPEAQRSQYQKYVEETFKDVEFTTASSNGQKSKSAELVVHVKIQRR